jgi:uncharacterized protein
MNSVDELIEALTPAMLADLKRAVELGKFPDGRVVSTEQRELMLEAVLRYEALHTPPDARTGFIDRGNSTCDIPDPTQDLIPTQEIPND